MTCYEVLPATPEVAEVSIPGPTGERVVVTPAQPAQGPRASCVWYNIELEVRSGNYFLVLLRVIPSTSRAPVGGLQEEYR